ncbi:hypothetical protein IMCGPPIG_01895 [Stenotrophomonas maltophilia]|uniref:hypothetical protein n=1 Tax=Stenotrophomonas sp. GD04064 TaxID=2975430 RepID=UPI000622B44E|nr:hypothetical protein [Stenotrophomonas sp. GD04064]KKF88302.1 hypothetical protein XY58_09750 [Stenotrophomonas maltophilia]MBA0255746.1 hypothetical protein [Stenotrophomonas maltophilia]MBA0452111.1 hypothetical protein [Stenotrophomonas maltophilia]MBA0480435.1 hypothetical protein [Stenotrophomonas maltophilia]MBA0489719.1 hypothetical protein [Stenotrophomonas maltophilia]
MARRHLSNPREGEGQGHGREIRELRALRNQVRDLQRQVDDLTAWRAQREVSARIAAAALTAIEAAPSGQVTEVRPAGLFARAASVLRTLFARGERNE